VAAYFYLASQLPYLIFGQQPPMSSEAYKDLARPLLGAHDAGLLDLVGIDPQPCGAAEGPSYSEKIPSSGSSFIDNWREWERALRLNLAKHRAAKTKRENTALGEVPFIPADAVSAASRAVSAESPLDGEMLIDRARWTAIEALQGIDYFSINSALAYLLKLILLERSASFQTETGFAEYKSLYAAITESIGSNSPAGETK
jgi:hypothetical protein